MNIKNIVFDFGGVLVDWSPRYLYEGIFEDHSEMEYFLSTVCNDEWNLQQDKGRPLSEATATTQQKFPDHHALIQLYYDEWETMLKKDIPENVKLLFRLNKNYKLYGLTNWSAETFPIALKRYSFFQQFEGIVVSGEEKMIKPDKEIFYVLLDRYKLDANQTVFIDDNINNIRSAKEIGFHVVHQGKGVNLENELTKMNLL
ncbi:MAG: HAD family phosphatase [Gammaproteobacteria bacterium]|mgnify:FL=1|jgi:2-haloacid dehalogenase|nr:HAD family phosphatase [Gammaproteobacteria bacterium]MBT3725320.1 HAD family phosphatase [Gammaproteobacteria bacterium]MBT4075016.1 HAD family phosphatase [Gammaproteobacteria bacterium]MBT4195366.1 HAD family phosphatase [Gammaproteobacteria bacterium]MBT4449669.1 HAD family phosphatase [Gammaproteobacteria bacterium]